MEISDETNYSKVNALKPNYQLFKLTQQSGGNSVTLSTSGGEQSVFEIPTNVVNLSRSFLNYTISTTAAGAGDFGNIFYNGTPGCIRDIELVTQSGERLVNIPNVTKYCQVVSLTDTPVSVLQSGSDESTLAPSNATSAGVVRGYKVSVSIGTATAHVNPVDTDVRQVIGASYVEPLHFVSVNNAALVKKFRIPLSIFKNSLLELDKDLWFGQILSLRVTYNPTDKISSDSKSVGLLTQIASATAPTLTGLNLYLAVEKNPILADQIKQQVLNSGLDVLCDYVHSYNRNLTGTSHALSYNFSRAHGRSLKKIYSVPYLASDTTKSNFYNHAYKQLANDAITNVYTQLNNERLQQWNMDTISGDEYMVMLNKLKGSCIQNQEHFLYNYFYADSWTDLKFHEREPNQKIGLPLDVEQKWDLNAVTGGARNWFTYAVCQRVLSIGKEGIVFK